MTPAPGELLALPRALRGHLPSLDRVRGIAILLVILHNVNPITLPSSVLERVVSVACDWGWVGVQLFFVLSGLLITGILLDTAHAPRRSYYETFFARRILRIFPLYYAVLFAAFVVVPLVTARAIDGHGEQVWLWLYLSNFTAPFGHVVPAFSHFWSLSVEEQFYLAWPLLVRSAGAPGVLRLGFALAVVALVSRVALRLAGVAPDVPYMFTFCRADALALGAIAAVLLRQPDAARWILERVRPLWWGAVGLFAIGAVVTRGYPRSSFMTQTVGYTLLACVFAVLVTLAVVEDARGARPPSLLRGGWLATLGKYSYAMYVFHPLIRAQIAAPLLARIAGDGSPTLGASVAYMLVNVGLSLAAAMASYHLFERHFLKLKSRFVAIEGTS